MEFSAVRAAHASSNRTWLGAIRGRVPNPQGVKQGVKHCVGQGRRPALETPCTTEILSETL